MLVLEGPNGNKQWLYKIAQDDTITHVKDVTRLSPKGSVLWLKTRYKTATADEVEWMAGLFLLVERLSSVSVVIEHGNRWR